MPDGLSQTFAALADPTRRAILAQLAHGDAYVSDLAQPFMAEMSLPAVTKHLKVLERAGLVRKTRAAQWRTCSLNPQPLKEATDWIEEYRRMWEASLDRLGDYLQELQGKPPRAAESTEPESAARNPASKSASQSTSKAARPARNWGRSPALKAGLKTSSKAAPKSLPTTTPKTIPKTIPQTAPQTAPKASRKEPLQAVPRTAASKAATPSSGQGPAAAPNINPQPPTRGRRHAGKTQ
jgi:DNA-binding transcriptional ArsR family regulator